MGEQVYLSASDLRWLADKLDSLNQAHASTAPYLLGKVPVRDADDIFTVGFLDPSLTGNFLFQPDYQEDSDG